MARSTPGVVRCGRRSKGGRKRKKMGMRRRRRKGEEEEAVVTDVTLTSKTYAADAGQWVQCGCMDFFRN